MKSLVTIILAAGKGTRMKSGLVKVLHPVAGRPMLAYPVRVAREAGADPVIVVVGHQQEQVEAAFADAHLRFVSQTEQLGTGHAVAVTEEVLQGFDGDVLILCGDVPLIRAETVQRLVAVHREGQAAVSVLSVMLDDPTGYGRIVRDAEGRCLRIVEHRDADAGQRAIREINTGMYCCDARFLFDALRRVTTDNDQGEYYLPDIVAIGVAAARTVQAVVAPDFLEVRGINDRAGLAEAEREMRRRIVQRHMEAGVTMLDPETVYIDEEVTIGSDTTLLPGTGLYGRTAIGAGCRIESGCSITNAVIGKNVHIRPACVIEDTTVPDASVVGPLAHLTRQ